MRSLSVVVVVAALSLVVGCKEKESAKGADSPAASGGTKAKAKKKSPKETWQPPAFRDGPVTGTIKGEKFEAAAVTLGEWNGKLRVEFWPKAWQGSEDSPCKNPPKDFPPKSAWIQFSPSDGEHLGDPEIPAGDIMAGFTFEEEGTMQSSNFTGRTKIVIDSITEDEVKGRAVAADDKNGHALNGTFTARRCRGRAK